MNSIEKIAMPAPETSPDITFKLKKTRKYPTFKDFNRHDWALTFVLFVGVVSFAYLLSLFI